MGSSKDVVSIAKHLGEEIVKLKILFTDLFSHKIKEHAFGLTLKRAGMREVKQVQLLQCLNCMEQSIIKKDMN